MAEIQKMPQILSGIDASKAWPEEIKTRLQDFRKDRKISFSPCLGVIQVGDNPASDAYIKQKRKAAQICGIEFLHQKLSSKSKYKDIQNAIKEFSDNPKVTGFIVQLPFDLEEKLDPKTQLQILELIEPSKDADGLHSFNQGRLFTGASGPNHWSSPLPATPLGILKLLDFYKIDVSRKDAVVIGKSRLVGFPTAVLLSHAGATVTLCHKQTRDLKSKCAQAEILVVAAGSRHLIQTDYIRPDAAVIDVGIHRNFDGKLTGDVDPAAVTFTGSFSPVPGGVGPMTVAALMENLCQLYIHNLDS